MSAPTDLFLVVEISDAEDWAPLAVPGRIFKEPFARHVPENRRPTVLQPDRETATAEAMRLAGRHPGKRFAIFRATDLAMTVDVPSHITPAGQVWLSRKVATLVEIDDSQVPF